ncbi:hypothetical protein [Viridibacillus arvi]|uniref:Uncharacterized protein n=1 Tax=Viridibacillus arvi TaxID=263475 RepID=A0A0M0LJK5_9BACL|nr:hypothetical protein [Viridibacillus arvi]KOO51229.1 hypothetical protein AMD00_01625 [Viridibacillus arvi]
MFYVKFILLFLFFILADFILGLFNAPTWIVMTINAIAGIAVIYDHIHTVKFSKNAKKIVRTMKYQKKNPFFAYVLAVKEGTLEDELREIERVMAKYKQPDLRNSLEFTKNYRLNDYDKAIQFAKKIEKEPLKNFYLAIADVLQKDYVKARSYTFAQKWMKHAIEAEIALQLKNIENYKKHMKLVIEESKGMQLILNQATFEKELLNFKRDENK